MKKLFIILLQKDMKLTQINQHDCELTWTSQHETYTIRFSDDGRLFISPDVSLVTEDLSLLTTLFFNRESTFHLKQGLDSLLISLSPTDYTYDSSFSTLYKQLSSKQTKTTIINLNDR